MMETSDHDAGGKSSSGLLTAPVSWKRGLVLLCSKCSGEQPDTRGPVTPPSWGTWKFRTWLKDRLTEKGLWPKIRVVTTSCMGVCHDGRITCVMGRGVPPSGEPAALVVDPEQDAEEVLERIVKELGETR